MAIQSENTCVLSNVKNYLQEEYIQFNLGIDWSSLIDSEHLLLYFFFQTTCLRNNSLHHCSTCIQIIVGFVANITGQEKEIRGTDEKGRNKTICIQHDYLCRKSPKSAKIPCNYWVNKVVMQGYKSNTWKSMKFYVLTMNVQKQKLKMLCKSITSKKI